MGDAMLAVLRVGLPLGYFLAGCTWLFWLWYFIMYIVPNTAMETGRERTRSLWIGCTVGIVSALVITALFSPLREFMTWSDLERDKILEGKRPEWLGPGPYTSKPNARAATLPAPGGQVAPASVDAQPQQAAEATPAPGPGLN